MAVAKKCKHCGEWLDEKESEELKEELSVSSVSTVTDDDDTGYYDPMEEVPKAVNIGIWVFTIIAVSIAELFLIEFALDRSESMPLAYSYLGKWIWIGCIALIVGIPHIVKLLKNIYNMIFY